MYKNISKLALTESEIQLNPRSINTITQHFSKFYNIDITSFSNEYIFSLIDPVIYKIDGSQLYQYPDRVLCPFEDFYLATKIGIYVINWKIEFGIDYTMSYKYFIKNKVEDPEELLKDFEYEMEKSL